MDFSFDEKAAKSHSSVVLNKEPLKWRQWFLRCNTPSSERVHTSLNAFYGKVLAMYSK
jgi:hypothetical protein